MTEIFNNAYNQANQILDGSGLSSVIHKQEGGSFSIGVNPYTGERVPDNIFSLLPSTAKFYLQQFQDKPMTDSEVKKTLAKSEINELIKAIERNQASPKDDQTIPGPIYDENGNILFDPEGQVTWDTPGYSKIDNQSFSDYFPGDPLFNLQNTMGKFYYGPANLAGEREIYDVYDWEKGDERGLQGVLGMIAKTYNDLKGREGRTVSFTVNPYKDQWEFNPETGEHINPEDQGPSQQNTGKVGGIPTYYDASADMGDWAMSDAASSTGNDAWDDMGDWAMSDAASSFKHGGKITSGGLIQLAEGSTRSDPYWDSIKERYNVEKMSDKKLADVLAREDILRSSISDEDLRKSGLVRIRTRPWAISQGEEFEKRKGGDKTAHIRKLYYLSLKRLLNEVKQNADRTGNSFPYEKMQRIVDKGMRETFPEGYVESIAPEYMGQYGMHLEPGDSQDFKDAYLGGGIPGPSFVPNKEQTAPVFESSSFEEIWDEIMRNNEDQAQSKKEGGGLAGITKSIDINGQPHKLAWINSDEASALKAMGGSGKKVGGIPAYFDTGMEYGDWEDAASFTTGDDGSEWGISGQIDGPGYADFTPPSADEWASARAAEETDFTPPSADEWASAVAAEESESKEFYKETAKDLIKLAGKAGSGWNEEDVNNYIAQVRVFAKNKYNKDPLMKSDVDREAARVLDRLAVEDNLPVWGIGMHYRDNLGANEPLHLYQYSDSEDKDGNKIPGGLTLSRRGYYGGKDSGVLSVLASIFGHTLIPGVPVIDSLAKTTIEGFHKANPNDPRYWPKPKRSLQDARQAVLNEQRDRIEGRKKGVVASWKELGKMYNLGSDGKVIKDGTNAKPYTPADISNYNYDDFWKSDDPSTELYQGNYEEYPQKLKKLPQVKKDLTEPEEKEEELTGMAALLAKRPEATSIQDSNVYLEALLNQIYGKPLGQSMLG